MPKTDKSEKSNEDEVIEAASNFALTGPKVRNVLTDGQATWAIGKFNSCFLGCFHSGEGGGPYKSGGTGNSLSKLKAGIKLVSDPHAEDHVIAALYEAINGDTSFSGHVTIKINKSPCKRCAKRLKLFKENFPNVTMRIKAIGLYTTNDSGIKGMNILQSVGIPVVAWHAETMAKSVLKGSTPDTAKGSGQIKGREFLALKDTSIDWQKYPVDTPEFNGATHLLAKIEDYKGVKDEQTAKALKFNGLWQQHQTLSQSLLENEAKLAELKKLEKGSIGERCRMNRERPGIEKNITKLSTKMKTTLSDVEAFGGTKSKSRQTRKALMKAFSLSKVTELAKFAQEVAGIQLMAEK